MVIDRRHSNWLVKRKFDSINGEGNISGTRRKRLQMVQVGP